MADIAWMELHVYERADDSVRTVAMQEGAVENMRVWVPPTPDDYRIAAGVKTELRLRDGSIIYVTDEYETIASLIKIKRL